jgi:hypothetical protein
VARPQRRLDGWRSAPLVEAAAISIVSVGWSIWEKKVAYSKLMSALGLDEGPADPPPPAA